MVRFDMPVQPVDAVGRTDRNGLCPAAEEIRKLPFIEISWPMSGNESLAEMLG
jgi:hypothetical protein